jgi:hypothetical protein
MKGRLGRALMIVLALALVLLAAIDALSAPGGGGSTAWLWEMPRVSVTQQTSAPETTLKVMVFVSPLLIPPGIGFVFGSPLATPEAP